jgi:hypothetical protein
MGREIRMVPPNWEHPKRERYDPLQGQYVSGYQPKYNRDFATYMREWFAEWSKWEDGYRPAGILDCETYCEAEGPPPDPDYYLHGVKPEDCTWFQVYETVSEGTPVTPPFATKAELVDYLTQFGDFWDQSRTKRGIQDSAPWSQANAESFVGTGFAMSLVVINGEIKAPRDGQTA